MAVLKLLPPSSVDLVITSPPYFDLKEYSNNPLRISTQSINEYLEDLKPVFDVILSGKHRRAQWINEELGTFEKSSDAIGTFSWV